MVINSIINLHMMTSWCVSSDLADTFCSNEIVCSSGTIFDSNGKIGCNWTNSNIWSDGTICSIYSNETIYSSGTIFCSNGKIGSNWTNFNICSDGTICSICSNEIICSSGVNFCSNDKIWSN